MKGTTRMTRIRRILCASDFSKTSGKAPIFAIDLAKANRARLTIFHAHLAIVPLVPEQYLEASTWDRVDTETRRWAERQVEKLAEKARKRGVRASALIRS
jgi:nucleotide-binding universal stress UspA family protein